MKVASPARLPATSTSNQHAATFSNFAPLHLGEEAFDLHNAEMQNVPGENAHDKKA